jgi:hypothetical protein
VLYRVAAFAYKTSITNPDSAGVSYDVILDECTTELRVLLRLVSSTQDGCTENAGKSSFLGS